MYFCTIWYLRNWQNGISLKQKKTSQAMLFCACEVFGCYVLQGEI